EPAHSPPEEASMARASRSGPPRSADDASASLLEAADASMFGLAVCASAPGWADVSLLTPLLVSATTEASSGGSVLGRVVPLGVEQLACTSKAKGRRLRSERPLIPTSTQFVFIVGNRPIKDILF